MTNIFKKFKCRWVEIILDKEKENLIPVIKSAMGSCGAWWVDCGTYGDRLVVSGWVVDKKTLKNLNVFINQLTKSYNFSYAGVDA